MQLNKGQLKGLKVMQSGANIALTGFAGVGKSFLIKEYVTWCEINHRKCYVTSTTGVSAILINGTTLHSWAGIGLGQDDRFTLLEKVLRSKAKLRWLTAKVLIIDEVSMLSQELLEKLDFIGKEIRKCERPFGGIQLIFSFDFAQLPPVESDFVFKSPIWNLCIDKTIYLTENMRQSDDIFRKILPEIRLGRITNEIIQILSTRVGAQIETPEGIIPTKLYSHRASVDKINKDFLDSLISGDNPLVKFLAKDSVKVKGTRIGMKEESDYLARIDKVCNGLKVLELAVGAQVMLTYNIDVSAHMVNGSRGVVTKFMNGLPVVRFMNGIECPISTNNWEMKMGEGIVAIRNQIPLMMAVAITIHKAQGATLDCAQMDLGNTIFAYGQAYTALSRCKSLDCISIVTFDPNKLMCSPDVKEYYENLEKELKMEEVIDDVIDEIDDISFDNTLCIICCEKDKEVVFLPCGHIICCFNCGSNLSICPLCKQDINQTSKVFL